MEDTRRGWGGRRPASFVVLGVIVGALLSASPAGAHFTESISHLWHHIEPKADKRYVNESEDLWAVVEADGTLQRGHGAVSASQPEGAGTYVVVFNRNVRNCAFLATLGSSGHSGLPPFGQIGVVGRNGNKHAIFVTTFDSSGVLTNASFHVQVACAGATVFAPPAARVLRSGANAN